MQIEKILSDLIAVKTDCKYDENKVCVDYICSILQDNEVLFKRIKNSDDNKESIIAGINVQSFKNIDSGLILSGHMDTVGANHKDWDTNPFQATDINGAIYGRGTVDMKYFIATVLSLIPEFKKLKFPIFLLFSCDEESSVKGICNLIQFLDMENIHPKFALVGEPTHFNVGVVSKGYAGYSTSIKGISAHSSCPDLGVNASYIAAKFVSKIEELSNIYKSQGTSLNVGSISGGICRNMIPEETTIDWEIRYNQELIKTEILQKVNDFCNKLVQEYKNSNIVTETKESLMSFEQDETSSIVGIAQNILKTSVLKLPHSTEAGFIKNIGVDTIICGAGNENLAHTSSEHILRSDLIKYRDFLLSFATSIQKKLISDFR